MDASPLLFVELLGTPAYRMVIPVYQRPYSWDEEQCAQLWDDILSVGKREGDKHFTGSVVWIQEGTASASGVTKRLLIDGQQRVTTLTLLLIALARLARDDPSFSDAFSFDEIYEQFLVHKFKKGDDHYKLALSQGDRATLRSLIDNLGNPDVEIDDGAARLIDNLALFEERLAKIEDPRPVWAGIQRLEIVSISLTQGQDNPQLIFESMNSTGKDLSSADLIRNFVIMAQPVDAQDELYRSYWRPVEEALEPDTYDEVFDEFVRSYLTVLYAPEWIQRRNVYPLFKRHIIERAYDKDGRIVELLREMRSYARYYAAITGGPEKDGDLRARFASLAKLDVGAVNPLLLSLYGDYEGGKAFSRDDFIAMLDMIESYLFRRAVCDCPTHGFNKYFPSLIARLNKVQDEGGDYREALTAFLLNERDRLRFPGDAEFKQELEHRNVYRFRRALYLLAKLENSYHLKEPIDFSLGEYTIEHIAPQNALAHEEWREALKLDEEGFEGFVHTLGNLTLTGFNAELSDGTFKEKKERATGGFSKQHLSLSDRLRAVDHWDVAEADARGRELAARALSVWPHPDLPADTLETYKVKRKRGAKGGAVVKLSRLMSLGLLKPGEELVGAFRGEELRATATSSGRLRLANGEEFGSPSLASARAVALQGGSGARNGWFFWRTVDGNYLDELRKRVPELSGGTSDENDRAQTMTEFWEGFYEYASGLPWFVELFRDQSERAANRHCDAGFGTGDSRYYLHALALSRKGSVGADMHCAGREAYAPLAKARAAIEEKYLSTLGGTVAWDELDVEKKGRTVQVVRPFDFGEGDYLEAYEWLARALRQLRLVVAAFGLPE